MLPEIGLFSLIIALSLACIQSGLLGFNTLVRRKSPFWLITKPLALGQGFFVYIAFTILVASFVLDDFSVAYVANHSNSMLPTYYKAVATWGAHEGSLLLWIMILNIWMVVIAYKAKDSENKTINWIALGVMSLFNVGLLLLLLNSSNPFLRHLPEIPLDGADLNPLLQDFAMTIHPPILYLGYIGFAVPFSYAISALLTGKVDQNWANCIRPWVLFSWGFLTVGIVLGSWWAYYELGWGGWWFWDPVENASFLPWLTGTALLHTTSVARKNGKLLKLSLFLAIITFSLSLLGTFLVRSGVLTSVHAFASDPARGLFILILLSVAIGGSLLLYGIRAPALDKNKVEQTKFSLRDKGILGNSLILLVMAGSILLGTLYPLIYDSIYAQKISVGPPYFNFIFIPMILGLLLLMTFILSKTITKFLCIVVTSIFASYIILYFNFGAPSLDALFGVSLGFTAIFSTVLSIGSKKVLKKSCAMILAHIGLGLTIIGVTIVSKYEIEKDVKISIGETVAISDYEVKFKEISETDGDNYIGHTGHFDISKFGRKIATLYPEKRLFVVQEVAMSETAILPGLFRDIYLALGEQFDKKTWSARVYYKPLVRWIWGGALLMVIGICLPVIISWRDK